MFIVNCLPPPGQPAGVGKRETGHVTPPGERTERIDIRLNFNRAINITMLWYIVFRNGLSGGWLNFNPYQTNFPTHPTSNTIPPRQKIQPFIRKSHIFIQNIAFFYKLVIDCAKYLKDSISTKSSDQILKSIMFILQEPFQKVVNITTVKQMKQQ